MLEILKLLEDNYQDNINYELYQLFVKYFFQELEERLGKKITTKEELETLFNFYFKSFNPLF